VDGLDVSPRKLPHMLTNVTQIHATWVCPENGEYALYRIRDGSVTVVEPGVCLRCMLKNVDGDEDDFEVTFRSTQNGLMLLFDYADVPTSLEFIEYRSDTSSIFVHESNQHKIYLRTESKNGRG
jgi:hypothetical protein